MGDTLDESPPSRRDKPQSLSLGPEQAAEEDASSARCARQRTRDEPVREREHSCDELSSASKRNEELARAAAPPRRESLNSCEPQQAGPVSGLHKLLGRSTTSAGSNSRYSSSVLVGGGVGNLAGTTTRKCVLTLDGYSYVIVASTPETLPGKREEGSAGGSNSSSSAASGAATSGAGGAGATGGATADSNNGEQSPTVCELGANATINGQVAKHGSLTIVRRSNSRKSFAQLEGPSQPIASPASAANSSNFFQEAVAERLGASRPGANGTPDSRTGESTARSSSSAGKMQPSSPNQTNFVTNASMPAVADRSAFDLRVGSESVEFQNSVTVGHVPAMFNPLIDQLSRQSIMSGSNTSVVGTWDTETLPPVDTPDALNKAAVRIRSLLRRMDHETVAYEDMQRNLHYAARVLEAVFIDESRSPTSGKGKLGQIASSSVESEDDSANKRCNGNCKNLNNNNSKTSCTLHNESAATEEQSATPQPPNIADNQSIDSRTKGDLLSTQRHSGPTESASPAETKRALETVTESTQAEQTATATTTTTTTATTNPNESTSGASAGQNVSNSSSCSNKATVQRQRRLRTPVWARSMSTNKTY